MSTTKYRDRYQFNWGFHDATADKERGRNRESIPSGELFCLPSWNSVYCAGYRSGQKESLANGRPESSESAWLSFLNK